MISPARFFGAPVMRAAGEAGAEGGDVVDVRAQPSVDGGDEVEDLLEALELQQLRDAHAAEFADLPEVVALEIGDHDEFGDFLWRR